MKFEGFQVTNYRNILNSGWIEANQITAFVGQNEAGKSNLFEALYCLNPMVEGTTYNIDEDWPVDQWGGKDDAKGKVVCVGRFGLTPTEIEELWNASVLSDDDESEVSDGDAESPEADVELPSEVSLILTKAYGYQTAYTFGGVTDTSIDIAKAVEWAKANAPKFVLIQDYGLSGHQVELDQLKSRLDAVGGQRHQLSNEDQTVLIVLDLAKIDLEDFIAKGQTQEGRTIRSFDKRSASRYLTSQFASLWQQKNVSFEIEIDGPTLNILAEDEAVGMPVRLNRRSTGFRWYVSFAWKFTHATKGDFANCILLLEEPGVHLHFSGQRDLLKVFERLSERNTILYTTHLASMVDQANPERVRIVESRDNHLGITQGIVSSQREPMAVIEQSLGLTGDQGGLLGNRQVLIVEGGDDALILHKISGLLNSDAKEGLSDRIYMWPAHGASKTPMFAGFAIGQGWDAGVLLDTDTAGNDAKAKIDNLYVSKLAEAQAKRFRTFMLGKATGSRQTDFAIEDLFPADFYIGCVNEAFGLAIKVEDLPVDGSDMITKRVEQVLTARYGHKELDKRKVMGEMLHRFDTWRVAKDLPKDTAAKAEKLFKAINATFAD